MGSYVRPCDTFALARWASPAYCAGPAGGESLRASRWYLIGRDEGFHDLALEIADGVLYGFVGFAVHAAGDALPQQVVNAAQAQAGHGGQAVRNAGARSLPPGLLINGDAALQVPPIAPGETWVATAGRADRIEATAPVPALPSLPEGARCALLLPLPRPLPGGDLDVAGQGWLMVLPHPAIAGR